MLKTYTLGSSNQFDFPNCSYNGDMAFRPAKGSHHWKALALREMQDVWV